MEATSERLHWTELTHGFAISPLSLSLRFNRYSMLILSLSLSDLYIRYDICFSRRDVLTFLSSLLFYTLKNRRFYSRQA